MFKNQNGVGHVALVLIVVLCLAVIGGAVYFGIKKFKTAKSEGAVSNLSDVTWSFNGTEWEPSGTPPACPDPLVLTSPVDVSQASSILYPGQERGGDYKAHGGFRLDNNTSSATTIVAAFDAKLTEASRYIENGETQYYFIFINPCGIMYKLDHLQALTPKFQEVANSLPPAQPDDSRTTKLKQPVDVKAGETIATAVGFNNSQNYAFDFGLYDLRNPTTAAAAAAENDQQFAPYGLCWLDNLPPTDAAIVKQLPAGDDGAGQSSSYCVN